MSSPGVAIVTAAGRGAGAAIAGCVRGSAARPRIAPVRDEQVAGLERIAGIGVPR